MADNKALVGNAADSEQVKRADRKVRSRDRNDVADLKIVLASAEGRRVLLRILEHCNVFKSVYHAEASEIYRNCGRQDVGHFLLSTITEASEQDGLLVMMRERHEYLTRERLDNEAAHERKEEQ